MLGMAAERQKVPTPFMTQIMLRTTPGNLLGEADMHIVTYFGRVSGVLFAAERNDRQSFD